MLATTHNLFPIDLLRKLNNKVIEGQTIYDQKTISGPKKQLNRNYLQKDIKLTDFNLSC